MPQISIETIDGKKCTVIYPLGDISEHEIKKAIWVIDWRGVRVAINKTSEGNEYVIAYALPALPRHPKPEHAPLLYRYMAEGLHPYGHEGEYEGDVVGITPDNRWILSTGFMTGNLILQASATNVIATGAHVEIAIEGGQ